MKKKGYRTPHEIAIKGFEALVEKLGPGGALQFIHQYETGRGDYTRERKHILRGVNLRKLKAALLK